MRSCWTAAGELRGGTGTGLSWCLQGGAGTGCAGVSKVALAWDELVSPGWHWHGLRWCLQGGAGMGCTGVLGGRWQLAPPEVVLLSILGCGLDPRAPFLCVMSDLAWLVATRPLVRPELPHEAGHEQTSGWREDTRLSTSSAWSYGRPEGLVCGRLGVEPHESMLRCLSGSSLKLD